MLTSTRPILILGGGINGAGIARELLLNGYSVVLVDKNDLGYGASSKLSRLVHGGLRYLEYGQFSLVRESLQERNRLLELSPHFIKPLKFKMPLRGKFNGIFGSLLNFTGLNKFVLQRPLDENSDSSGRIHHAKNPASSKGSLVVNAGLMMYRFLSGNCKLPPNQLRKLSSELDAGLSDGKFDYVAEFHDARVTSPERFLFALIHDCQTLARDMSLNFSVFTYHSLSIQKQNVQLHPTGTKLITWEFEPQMIINATGAWTDMTLQELNIPSIKLLQGTSGTHILTRHPHLKSILGDEAYYVQTHDNRLVFIIPQQENVLIGTTEKPCKTNPSLVVPAEDEINYLLMVTNNLFRDLNITRKDIYAAYSGVRPLVDQKLPSNITSRSEKLILNRINEIPVLSVAGGKWTTFRSLAEKALNAVAELFSFPQPVNSRERLISGSRNYPLTPNSQREYLEQLERRYDIPVDQLTTVFNYVGTFVENWLADSIKLPILARRNSPTLAGTSIPISFIEWIIQTEYVLRLEDLVERRLILWEFSPITRKMLEQLVQLLVDAGRYYPDEASQIIDRCLDRLSTAYSVKLD